MHKEIHALSRTGKGSGILVGCGVLTDCEESCWTEKFRDSLLLAVRDLTGISREAVRA